MNFLHSSCMDPENFVRFLKSSTYFTESCKKNWSNCFSRWFVSVFLNKPIAICDFPVWTQGPPLDDQRM